MKRNILNNSPFTPNSFNVAVSHRKLSARVDSVVESLRMFRFTIDQCVVVSQRTAATERDERGKPGILSAPGMFLAKEPCIDWPIISNFFLINFWQHLARNQGILTAVLPSELMFGMPGMPGMLGISGSWALRRSYNKFFMMSFWADDGLEQAIITRTWSVSAFTFSGAQLTLATNTKLATKTAKTYLLDENILSLVNWLYTIHFWVEWTVVARAQFGTREWTDHVGDIRSTIYTILDILYVVACSIWMRQQLKNANRERKRKKWFRVWNSGKVKLWIAL